MSEEELVVAARLASMEGTISRSMVMQQICNSEMACLEAKVARQISKGQVSPMVSSKDPEQLLRDPQVPVLS
jgi:hypothetical protein